MPMMAPCAGRDASDKKDADLITENDRTETEIILAGGGHAHVEVIRQWAMNPSPRTRMTLIARDIQTPYTGMLPGLIAGLYDFDEAHIDLRRLCRHAGVRLIHAAADGIDADARTVSMTNRPPLRFDWLSVDIGSTPDLRSIRGAREHAIGVKPVDQFLVWLNELEQQTKNQPRNPVRLAIIGGGAGGTELALSLAHRFGDRVSLLLISASDEVVPEHSSGVRQTLRQALTEAGVELHRGSPVTEIRTGSVILDNGESIPADKVICTTRASAPDWLATTGLALDSHGFIAVDDCLQSLSHPHILAAGDIASMTGHDLPKAGVYAVRQGPVLAESLQRLARGKPAVPYHPQSHILALISTGKRHAVASYGPLSISGDWVWRWKDGIDRKWMEKYQDLPVMAEPSDPQTGDSLMRCGGCGAKVSSLVLKSALARVRQIYPQSIGDLGDDAAIITPPTGQSIVQSVDQFRQMIDDPFLFGQITAEHCLSDLHAMGAAPYGALVTVTLPDGEPEVMADDLTQILSGVTAALAACGALLLGGHTAEGAELTLGLAVTGFIDPKSLSAKGGARGGDKLILTKPLGTGAIMAADMRGRARTEHVEAAVDSMRQSNGPAARILHDYGVTAATDVTGFGLAGHLIEMMTAARTVALLDPASLPVLPGYREAEAAGILSTMYPKNLPFAAHFDGQPDDIFFDPQTSGGLLAALPDGQADACLAALQKAGIPARIIGSVATQAAGSKTIWLI